MPKKQKILKYILFFLTLLLAFLSWFSVDQAITVPDSSTWGAPIFWFALFFVSLSLCLVLIKRLIFVELLLIATFALSTIFILGRGETGKHLVVILLAFLFAAWGIGRIRQDLKMNIKIDLWKTLKTGSTFLILAFSLIITSQYYCETKNTRLENTLPKFQIKALSDTFTSKFLASFNPDFEDLDKDGITVDEFILEAQKKKLTENPEEGNAKLLETSQAFLLEKGRSEMSELTGKKLTGQEKMADVFAAAVNNKINDFVAPNFSGNSHSPARRLIIAFLLFLTVVSLGSFLGIFLIPLTKLIFWILKKIGLIEIKKLQKEVEEIV
jgi:hypothetical protein